MSRVSKFLDEADAATDEWFDPYREHVMALARHAEELAKHSDDLTNVLFSDHFVIPHSIAAEMNPSYTAWFEAHEKYEATVASLPEVTDGSPCDGEGGGE